MKFWTIPSTSKQIDIETSNLWKYTENIEEANKKKAN